MKMLPHSPDPLAPTDVAAISLLELARTAKFRGMTLLCTSVLTCMVFICPVSAGERPMTAGQYLELLKEISNDRISDEDKFARLSKRKIGQMIDGVIPKFDRIFSIHPEYNEVILGCLIGVGEGLPLRGEEISKLKSITVLMSKKVENDDETSIIKSMESKILKSDRKTKNRLGLPTDQDVNLLDIKLDSDVKLIAEYVDLDPMGLFKRKKWPGVRPEIDRPKRWLEIEGDPHTMTMASQKIILEMLGAEEGDIGKKVFSDPYFNFEAIYILSTVGNGFSIKGEDLKDFRRRCDLVAARSKSEKEFSFLSAFYALILRADQEVRKKGN